MDIRPFAGAGGAPSVADNFAAVAARSSAGAIKSTSIAVDTPQAVDQTSAAPSPDQTRQAVQKINTALSSLSQSVVFSIDEGSNNTVVKVVDSDTKEVLRQMPTKEALEIARALDRVQGMLIKQKV